MTEVFDESTLRAYLLDLLEPEMRTRVAEQRKIVGSPTYEWFRRMGIRLENPLSIDWLAMASHGTEAEERSPQERDPNAAASESDITDAGESTSEGGFLDSFESQTAAYFRQELEELKSQLNRDEVYRSDPLAPYRTELRRLICQEWKWSERRNEPALRDPVTLAVAIATVIRDSGLPFPFSPALVAVVLVREGLEHLCEPFR